MTLILAWIGLIYTIQFFSILIGFCFGLFETKEGFFKSFFPFYFIIPFIRHIKNLYGDLK